MAKNLGRYIRRLFAFTVIVIGAETTNQGMEAMKIAQKAGETSDMGSLLLGIVMVVGGCLIMAKLSVEKQKEKKGRIQL